MAKNLPPDASDPLEALFGDIFLKLMNGMIRAEPVEAKFPTLGAKLKDLTRARMRRVAIIAGKYYAQHANPSPEKLSKDQVDSLKTKAIEVALEQVENETKTKE
jgi:hypothetical protein